MGANNRDIEIFCSVMGIALGVAGVLILFKFSSDLPPAAAVLSFFLMLPVLVFILHYSITRLLGKDNE